MEIEVKLVRKIDLERDILYKEKTPKKVRNSNFEILRLISMLLIVVHHFAHYGTFDELSVFSTSKLAIDLLKLGGKVGVDIFILIGSYFLVGKKFKLAQPVYLLVIGFAYSASGYLIALLSNQATLGFVDIYRNLFLIPSQYWFLNAYVMFLCIVPLLNFVVKGFSKATLAKVIVVMTILWAILANLTDEQYGYSRLGFFAYLFLISSYIKLYLPEKEENIKKVKASLLKFVGLSFAVILLINCIGIWYPPALSWTEKIFLENNFLTLAIAVTTFLLFKNLPPRRSKGINYLASATFGVYLIHENIHVRPWLWHAVDNASINGGLGILVFGILYGLLIFVACLLLSLLVNRLEPIFSYVTNLICIALNSLNDKVNKVLDKVD